MTAATTHLDVQGMHCASCVGKVEGALAAVPGVEGVEVDLSGGTARVGGAPDGGDQALLAAVAGAGAYTASVRAAEAPPAATTQEAPAESLYPLFLIVGYLAGAVVLGSWALGDLHWQPAMRRFMAGFFLVFSFFKLLDLRGFVDAYRGYDLVAAAVPAWAFAYPFVELALGALYLADVAPVPVNWVTLVLMTVGAAGVLKALLDDRRIRCACLGTALNLPMTKVTLVEDLTMAAMAGAMLAL